jgi:hypothetical protein
MTIPYYLGIKTLNLTGLAQNYTPTVPQILINSDEVCHLPNLNATLQVLSAYRLRTSQRDHSAKRRSSHLLSRISLDWRSGHLESLHQVCKWFEQTPVRGQDPI